MLQVFTVFPSKEKEFIEAFGELQDSIEDQEGIITFGLSRTLDTNAKFYQYSVSTLIPLLFSLLSSSPFSPLSPTPHSPLPCISLVAGVVQEGRL